MFDKDIAEIGECAPNMNMLLYRILSDKQGR